MDDAQIQRVIVMVKGRASKPWTEDQLADFVAGAKWLPEITDADALIAVRAAFQSKPSIWVEPRDVLSEMGKRRPATTDRMTDNELTIFGLWWRKKSGVERDRLAGLMGADGNVVDQQTNWRHAPRRWLPVMQEDMRRDMEIVLGKQGAGKETKA